MLLITGLGNPGPEYADTRHNLGFMVLDELARRLTPGESWKEKYSGLSISTNTPQASNQDHQKMILLKPQTYMNNSGISIADAKKFYKIAPENIWVIYDDLDIDFGKVRIRLGGSPAGHNGLKSIDKYIGTQKYYHIRVGIGSADIPVDSFVTGKFKPHEYDDLPKIITETASRIETAINKDDLEDHSFTIID